MPRTFLNTVRGYREQTFWDSDTGHDNQNVMKTRSGLTIRTVPSVRRSNSRTNLRTTTIQPSSDTPESPKWRRFPQNNQTSHKSMSCLSFVTRYNMLIKGTNLEFSDSAHKFEQVGTDSMEDGKRFKCEAIEDLSSDFRAQLNDHGLLSRDEFQHDLQDNSDSPIETENRMSFENYASVYSSFVFKGDDGKTQICTSESNVEGPRNSAANVQSEPPNAIGEPCRTLPFEQESSSELPKKDMDTSSKTRVLLTVSSTAKPCPPQSFKLGDKHYVQAQMVNGRPLLYNNIPVMVVNRISAAPETQMMPPSPVKPVSTQIDSELNSKSPLRHEHLKSLTFSPVRHVRSTTEKEFNSAETDEDDSSDTCSQGSQDSSISDFDLSIFQMESHVFAQDANGNQIHKCKICDRVFTVFAAFKAHVNSHVKVKNRCAICGKIFSRSWLLKGHMRTHTGEKPFECPHPGCQKRFADKSNLRSHQLIHTITDKTYICPKCHRAFAQKRYLHKHRLEVCKY